MNQQPVRQYPPLVWDSASTTEPPEGPVTDFQVAWSDLVSEVVAKSARDFQAIADRRLATDKAVRDDDFRNWQENPYGKTTAPPVFTKANKVAYTPWSRGNVAAFGERLPSSGPLLWLITSAMLHTGRPAAGSAVPWGAMLTHLGRESTDGLLEKSLEELRGVPEEAAEDGYPVPGEVAIKNAQKTLRRLHRHHPGRYTVCPTEEGDVAISVPVVGMGKAMTIECDSDGGLICFVNVDGHMRRMKDYDADTAWESSDFIVRALSDLRA